MATIEAYDCEQPYVIPASSKQSKYSIIVQLILPNTLGRPVHHYHQAHLIHYFSQAETLLLMQHDPMQNLGQTRIFYKPGYTHLTQTIVTRVIQMTRPGFNPGSYILQVPATCSLFNIVH